MTKHREIETEEKLIELLKSNKPLTRLAFQSISFIKYESLLQGKIFTNCLFLGCHLPHSLEASWGKDNLIFPLIDAPFNPYRASLYDAQSLFGEYQLGQPKSYQDTLDNKIYTHFLQTGKEALDIKETLSRRLHDHAITNALYEFIAQYDEKKVVGIMGGHGLLRSDKDYLEIARTSKQLTELGYLLISGGGPGAMEATHLGAWFAGKSDEKLIAAVNILAEAPSYKDEYWLDKSFLVMSENPNPQYQSVGIPTWLYGHEPPTPFATHIAKYFANSVREDGLLTIAKGGIIFAPGSAGTIQEIFQEATQNHYLSFDYASPMVFFNSHYWIKEYPIYPLLNELLAQGKYKNLILSIGDSKEALVEELEKFASE